MKQIYKEYISIIILFLFSFIACIKLFNSHFYTTHDGGGHIIRMEEFHLALNDGQFPVRIAKRINYGLGYPYFHFNYPFVYYVSDLFLRAGLSPVEAFKALMFLSVFFGGYFMYRYTNLFYSKEASIISGVSYIIVPYRFLNMYVRGTLGEMVGLAILPAVFFSIECVFQRKNASIYPFIIFMSILILSHNITALIGGILAFIYFSFRLFFVSSGKMKYIVRFGLSGIMILLTTSFFWYPALVDAPETKLSELREDYREFFPLLQEIIYSPWGFGSWTRGLAPGKMSPQIGIVHTMIILAGLILLFFNVRRKKISLSISVVLFYYLTIALLVVFMLEVSRPIWDDIPVLQVVQHPWRFVGFVVFGASFISGYVIHTLAKVKLNQQTTITAFIVLLLYANRNHIRVNMYIDYISPFADENSVYALSTTSKDEHMPRLAPRITSFPNPNGEFLNDSEGTSTRIVWKSNYHKFELQAKKKGLFRDNTSYFPGWVAQVDNQTVPIQYKNDPYRRLVVQVTKGKHVVEFFFLEPMYRKIVNAVSVLSLMLLVILRLCRKKILLY